MSIEFTGISETIEPEKPADQTETTSPPEIAKTDIQEIAEVFPEIKTMLPVITGKAKKAEPIKVTNTGKTRHTYSINFPINEGDYVNEVIAARIAAGITDSAAHFFVQCVDFVVNHKPGTTFAMPAIEKVPFKNGFYNRVSKETVKK